MEYRRADVKVSGVGIGRPDLSGNTDKLMLLWLLRTASSQQLLMKGYFHPIWLTNDIDWFLPVDFESATNRWCCDGRNGGMIDLVKWVSLAAENRRLLDSKLLKRWQESWAQSQPSIRLFGALLKTKKALRTFCEDTVIQLQHVGSQSTSRKCDELKQVSNR